jgi:drug/metabolite transporter (DMT)-like permease
MQVRPPQPAGDTIVLACAAPQTLLALALLPLGMVFARERAGDQPVRLPERVSEHLAVAMPGVFLAVDLAAWHTSLHLTSVANSTLLANLAPIFVTLFSWLVLRQRIGLAFLTALMVSIFGAPSWLWQPNLNHQ